jgi:hypothetical protein
MKSMNVRKTLSLSILSIVATVPCVPAAFSADELTFEQVAKASKTYFRDSAEFPLRISVEMTATDLSGRVRKHKTGKFKYDFHGYNQRSGNATGTLYGPKGMSKPARGIAISSLAPMALLSLDVEKDYTFTLAEPVEPGLLSARLAPIPDCPTFQWLADAYGPKSLCGSFQIQMQADDLALKHLVFDAVGLPVSANIDFLGPATLSSYHVEAEFQKVFLPGDPKPFLVPKLIVVTVETDKGKLVMSSNYAPRK